MQRPKRMSCFAPSVSLKIRRNVSVPQWKKPHVARSTHTHANTLYKVILLVVCLPPRSLNPRWDLLCLARSRSLTHTLAHFNTCENTLLASSWLYKKGRRKINSRNSVTHSFCGVSTIKSILSGPPLRNRPNSARFRCTKERRTLTT